MLDFLCNSDSCQLLPLAQKNKKALRLLGGLWVFVTDKSIRLASPGLQVPKVKVGVLKQTVHDYPLLKVYNNSFMNANFSPVLRGRVKIMESLCILC
jgi:hypothetical protein